MADETKSFHFFPQLPTELRFCIWRECLPHRVCELDYPSAEYLNAHQNPLNPCLLYQTSRLNATPPVITRVCRESRQVAFETGGFAQDRKDVPIGKGWFSSNCPRELWWEDRARDSYHLNWDDRYDRDFKSIGDPLPYLAWHNEKMMSNRFSVTAELFNDRPDATSALDSTCASKASAHGKAAASQELPIFLIVICYIIVHSDLKSVAESGMFGLLGDARVQVVDATDESRVDAFFDIAERLGDKAGKTVGQLVRQEHLAYATRRMQEISLTRTGLPLPINIRPAYMFRLCTSQCYNIVRPPYYNPLYAASSEGDIQTVRTLLCLGARVNARYSRHCSALEAASGGGHEQVVALLIDQGAGVESAYGALLNASQEGHAEVVRTLFAGGVTIRDDEGVGLLEAASYGGHERVVSLLIDNGADINGETDVEDGESHNPLITAVRRGHTPSVKLLLDKGANINHSSKWCSTALHYATCAGDEQMIKILLERGAVNQCSAYCSIQRHSSVEP